MANQSILDLITIIFYIPIILLLSSTLSRKDPYRRYFVNGMLLKILGGLAFSLVYIYHYKGGDTILYWQSSVSFSKLLLSSPGDFFQVYFGEISEGNYLLFNEDTGYPHNHYYFKDGNALFLIRILTPFVLLGLNTYFGSTILVSAFSYLAIWKLIKTISTMYPHIKFRFIFFAILMPSTLFWGSGILKDTFTLFGLCLMVTSFHGILIEKKNYLKESMYLALGAFLTLMLKPYVLTLAIPSLAIIFGIRNAISIRNKLVAYLMIPIVLSIMALLLFTLRNQFESDLGSYGSLDEIAKKAHISAEDLKRSAYQGNSFDIGSFDPTIQGMLSKFPQATIAGLFRPFIWEVNNVAMLISGVENTVLLFALIFAIIKARMRLIRIIMTDYFMLFCVVFSVLFAFSIGISTSNFGSLVRFKIPFLPFFTFFLFKVIFDRKN